LEYSNPEIPEGINTSKGHPLKEFFWLTSGVLVSIFAAIFLLVVFVDALTSYIPFSVEKEIPLPEFEIGTTAGPLPEYLQSLTDRIVEAQSLPDEMKITVHYVDDGTVNAFATLAGHVFLFRGLLEKLQNENALVMLIAHEVAHVKHRHPIKSLGRGLIAGLALSVISTTAGDAVISNFLGEAGYLTILKYSREMESESDETAIKTLQSIYGHLAGAEDLFKAFQDETEGLEPPEFFSTHPLTDDRIAAIRNSVAGEYAQDNQVTALPNEFKTWLVSDDK